MPSLPVSDPKLAARPAMTAAEMAELKDVLKRCSPGTFEAACEFRRTGNPRWLGPVITGVIERYVERELRPKLKVPDDNLRLVDDLGLDSLTMMEIVLLAEDVLRINVSNEELTRLRTLGDIRHFITAKVAAQ